MEKVLKTKIINAIIFINNRIILQKKRDMYMAGALEIRTGTRLQTAFDTVVGVTPQFDMLCTFARSLDESAFLVSVPMKDGQPLPIDDTKKMLFAYGSGEEKVIMAGYADDLVTEGIRRYWKIRRVTEQRQFLERVNERYKITLRLEYTQETWMPDEDGVMRKVRKHRQRIPQRRSQLRNRRKNRL